MTRRRTGFTLVELMVVVAIIGVLAAIALPNFRAMSLRAKRAEVPPNVTAIAQMEVAYEGVFDEFKSLPDPHPRIDLLLDQDAVPWDNDAEVERLGWSPSGEVRGNYIVNIVAANGEHVLVTGKTDIDDDDDYAIYTCTEKINTALITDKDTY